MSTNPVSSPTQGPYLTTISAPTSNFTNLTNAVANIDLGGNNGAAGYGDTDYQTSLGDFNSAVLSLAPSGNGLSPSTPLNFVFLVTDGVQDTYSGSCAMTHCTAVIDPSLCNMFKSKATVGVIYTTYLPVYQNNDPTQGYDNAYRALVLPIASQIAPNLRSCASSAGYFFQADDGPALISAMEQLFASTSQPLVITQ